jgi:hypothetical protein
MSDEESYIPYLVLVRFDKDGGDVKARVMQSAPVLKDVLTEIGNVQSVEMYPLPEGPSLTVRQEFVRTDRPRSCRRPSRRDCLRIVLYSRSGSGPDDRRYRHRRHCSLDAAPRDRHEIPPSMSAMRLELPG